MFTGLVEAVGTVTARAARPSGARLDIETPFLDLHLGDSVCVMGACLTVTTLTGGVFAADCSRETLARTTLGELDVGAPVHLERALLATSRLGGHLVSGHVDGVGTLRSTRAVGDARELWFDAPPGLARYIAEKGSMAIDGVSLTVNALDARGFSVTLVPHTLSKTTLGRRSVGARVNLEVDLVARYVDRLLSGTANSRDLHDTLARAGFTDPR